MKTTKGYIREVATITAGVNLKNILNIMASNVSTLTVHKMKRIMESGFTLERERGLRGD